MDNIKGVGRPSQHTPSVAKGKNYLLAIGIDAYENHPDLKKAVADAEGFSEVMTRRYGFELMHPPIINDKAKQRNILKALGKCESLDENDTLIVYYSGHGWYKPSSKLGYLVPFDAEDDPHSDFISVSQISDILRAVPVRHILLIVDCCFGGSFGIERNIHVDVKMTEKYIANLDTKRSRMLLSSGGIEPVFDGLVDDNNSPFTTPLLEFLETNQLPTVVLSEFFNSLAKRTLWNTDQMPQYKVLQHLGHDGGELALYCTDLASPEERAYNEALETNSISVLEKFIRDFPKSEYKAAIRSRLKEKRAATAWEKIKNSRHYEKFDEFLDDYEDSPFAELARQKMTELATHIKAETPKPEIIKPPVIITPPQYEFEPEMIFVEGGTFKMGSNDYDTENPIHDVSLKDFYIGKFPITQKQWQGIMGTNPSHFKGDNLPVESVNWHEAQEFLKKLSDKTGKKYRLPTEAEWEYAARGGKHKSPFKFSGSDNIDEVAWYRGNSESQTHTVGTKKANKLDIYDMSGNVWEWCEDVWHDNYDGAPKDGTAWTSGGKEDIRVVRGGSWNFNDDLCRVSNRSNFDPNLYNYLYGFRCVRYD